MIGTIYKEMKLKPSILQEYNKVILNYPLYVQTCCCQSLRFNTGCAYPLLPITTLYQGAIVRSHEWVRLPTSLSMLQ